MDGHMEDTDPVPGSIVYDYKFVRNAWMKPDGTLHHVPDYGHSRVAREVFGKTCSDDLEDAGWVHISCNLNKYIINRHELTARQMNTLFDMFMDADKCKDSHVPWQSEAYKHLKSVLNIGKV